jgi:hypothetical protein
MHTAALLAGILLLLFCGAALIIGLSIRAAARRELQRHGIQEALPKDAVVEAIVAGHALGVFVAALMIFWGLRGL